MGEAISGTEGNGNIGARKPDGEAKGKRSSAKAGKGGGSDPAQGGSGAAGKADAGTEERGTASGEAEKLAGQSSVRVEPPTIQYPDPVPEPISLDQLRGRKQEAKAEKQQQVQQPKPQPVKVPSLRTGIELLAKAVYSVPALAQQGDWWYLSNEEAKTIGEQGEAALSTLESKRLQAATKFFNSVAPWVALVITVISVTYIRVQMTGAAYAKARSLGSPSGPANQNSGPAGNGGVSGSGAAAGAGAAKDRIAERLNGLD